MSSATRLFPWLDVLPVARLTLHYRLRTSRTFTGFTEARVRSSLGNFLRALEPCAPLPIPPCKSCPLIHTCTWHRNFAGEHEGWPTQRLRPFTFSIELPAGHTLTGERRLEAGERVCLHLTLFGAQAQTPHKLVQALSLEAAGQALWLGPVQLLKVETLAPSVPPAPFAQESPPGSIAHPWSVWLDPARQQLLSRHTRLQLLLLSPLQARVNRGVVIRAGEQLSFHDLSCLAIRRTYQLAQELAPTSPEVALESSGAGPHPPSGAAQPLERRLPSAQQEPIHALARQVTVSERALKWQSWTRIGSRSHQQTDLGGLSGSMNIEGPLEPLLPLLLAAELSHLGKHAAFGLGRLRIQTL